MPSFVSVKFLSVFDIEELIMTAFALIHMQSFYWSESPHNDTGLFCASVCDACNHQGYEFFLDTDIKNMARYKGAVYINETVRCLWL